MHLVNKLYIQLFSSDIKYMDVSVSDYLHYIFEIFEESLYVFKRLNRNLNLLHTNELRNLIYIN